MRRNLRQEGGQILPMTALMMVVLCGFAALVIDIGRVWIAQRQLQNAVDATALAIGQNMPNDYAGWCQAAGANASTDCGALSPRPPAFGYSGIAGGVNALFGYGVAPNTPTVQFTCVSVAPGYTSGTCTADASTQDTSTPCQPGNSLAPIGTGCNAVIVKQTASVKTTFAAIPPFSFAKFTVSATSVASARGGATKPLDVAVVVDSTASMNASCGDNVPGIPNGQADKIDCAKQGVRTLLTGLWPCGQSYQNCNGQAALDRASLLTFPALKSPNAYTHDTTTPPLLTNLNLEGGCPGNYAAAPFWYQNSGGNGDEVQRVTVSAATFKLTFGGSSTATLTKSTTTAAALQTNLQGLSSIGSGNVSVSGNTGGPYTITFVGNLGNQNVAQMTGTNVTVTTPTAGATYDTGGFPGWFLDSADITYSGSPTYAITPLSNDYKTSSGSAFNTSSSLVSAVTWSNCSGGTYPGNEYYGLNSPGGAGTYYAGAITAAQNELALSPARGAQPVIILLSDGDANTQSPAQCTRAVQAAQSAAAAGTWVYSVMYGQTSTNGGCSGDGRYTAYTAMKAIASDPTKFFCDPKPVGASCLTAATLNDIFVHIAQDVTNARIIG